ncbi:hypothetical protein V1L54_07800 [Streptomyces sp. TRM 70361]|uniref:hypothetical protein n=1 Tax=Streptomyces sp. TRM 70361 TaxID=3116553 RepID=UPI002E7B3FF3|nr:hypothetical protein [Streptomyces sp. TRM 70361]MEE1939316.1 hypothetical protein [Streptomyces sp. TRM 70361]
MEIDPGLCLDVPEGFDDSDAETQVHPVARKLFHATTAAGVLRKAAEWVEGREVFLVDTSWDFLHDEDEPYWLSVYFGFEQDSEDS